MEDGGRGSKQSVLWPSDRKSCKTKPNPRAYLFFSGGHKKNLTIHISWTFTGLG